MTRYAEDIATPVAFPEQEVADTLAETLSAAGIRQLHAAETEKYAHVTYFFNGGEESAWDGETRVLVPSPRDVASYDLAPEMSAAGVADEVDESAARRLRLLRRQLRQPRHGRPHGSHPRSRAARSRRQTLHSAGSSRQPSRSAASAS